MEIEHKSQEIVPFEEIPYTGDRSPEFDALVKSRDCTNAPQDGLSEVTKDRLITSGWHVPCHCIVIRTAEGDCQAFHVQPNKLSASLLTFDQNKAMEKLSKNNSTAIAAKGKLSWFGNTDKNELSGFGISLKKVIDIDSSQWWRLAYDPKKDEVWIDAREQKTLKKYQGFNH